jgi:hypothetical protein
MLTEYSFQSALKRDIIFIEVGVEFLSTKNLGNLL